MRTRNMLYRREYDINDAIHIKIPTVGEILECEDGVLQHCGDADGYAD